MPWIRASWESFIIRLDILNKTFDPHEILLRIFHYSPWYTYHAWNAHRSSVENLSLFALIYLLQAALDAISCWESFIIRLDILTAWMPVRMVWLRIFHYSPWYTYALLSAHAEQVENLSLFALIYLPPVILIGEDCWESFIIRLDILRRAARIALPVLRIFHYSPWYT